MLIDLNAGPPVPGGNDITRFVTTRFFAAFEQAGFRATDDFTLLGGIGYTDEESEYGFGRVVAQGAFFGFVPPLSFAGEISDDNVSGMLGARYDFGDHTAYFTWSRG